MDLEEARARIHAHTRADEWHAGFQSDTMFVVLSGLLVLGWILFWTSRDDRFRRSLFLRLMPMTVTVGVLALLKTIECLDATVDLFGRPF